MGEYTAYFRKIPDLTENDHRDIVRLYLTYYDGSNEAQILSDLNSKSEVLLVFCDAILVGFTTLQVYEFRWHDEDIRIIYSGDTIVDKAHWGQQALAFAWIARMGELKREKPTLKMYWFVIIKGHRTYKYLPTFGKSFYPHWSIDRSDLKPLADALATQKFGDYYNPATGLVEFPVSQGHLKDDIALPSPEELTKDSVQFFLAKNPNYRLGHELVCVCEIAEENMKPLTKRIFSKHSSV
jgi:hypothetical protein